MRHPAPSAKMHGMPRLRLLTHRLLTLRLSRAAVVLTLPALAACLAGASALAAEPSPTAPAKAAPAPKAAADKPAAKPSGKAPAKKPAAPKDPYAVTAPRDPAALFANLKRALDSHLLLSDRFYEDQTLLRFFGAQQARWMKLPRPFIKSGKLTGMDAVFTPAPDARSALAVDVLVKYVNKETLEKRRAMIGMDLGFDARANVDALITAFGREGRVTDPNQGADPSRPRATTPGSHPLGNKLVSYDFDGPKSVGVLNAYINGDGVIGNLIITEEQKEWSIAPLVASPPPAPSNKP